MLDYFVNFLSVWDTSSSSVKNSFRNHENICLLGYIEGVDFAEYLLCDFRIFRGLKFLLLTYIGWIIGCTECFWSSGVYAKKYI